MSDQFTTDQGTGGQSNASQGSSNSDDSQYTTSTGQTQAGVVNGVTQIPVENQIPLQTVNTPVVETEEALPNTTIVADKGKDAFAYMEEAAKKYIIPSLVREKFPDLVKLIYETESMNSEEREYWLQILPIMTETQIVKFREILVNEKEQLSKLDTEYQRQIAGINKAPVAPLDEAAVKEKHKQLLEAEMANEKSEAEKEDELLAKLQDL